MTIKVENNFVENNFFWDLCKLITNSNFPWYIEGQYNDLVHNLIYKSHLKKENSFYASKILDPIIVKLNLNLKNIISSKITLNFSSSTIEKKSTPEKNIDLISKIRELGHHIGLHQNPPSSMKLDTLKDYIMRDITILEDCYGFEIDRFAFHRPKKEYLNYYVQLDNKINCYDKKFFHF